MCYSAVHVWPQRHGSAEPGAVLGIYGHLFGSGPVFDPAVAGACPAVRDPAVDADVPDFVSDVLQEPA